MANRVVDCGVTRNPSADIRAIPSVTDIGVPVDALIATQKDPNGQTHRRSGTTIRTENALAGQIGVPYNPFSGTINYY